MNMNKLLKRIAIKNGVNIMQVHNCNVSEHLEN